MPYGTYNYQYPYGQQPGYQPTYQPTYQPSYQPTYQQPTVQQPSQGPTLSGRCVGSPEEITVAEVPTDGTMGWYPATDGSCVWGKRWTGDGNIVTVKFVPDGQSKQDVDPMEGIDAKLDEIISLLEQRKTRRTSNGS